MTRDWDDDEKFYELDEPVDKIRAIFERGIAVSFVQAPPETPYLEASVIPLSIRENEPMPLTAGSEDHRFVALSA